MFSQIKRLTRNAGVLAMFLSLLTFTVALAASGGLDATFSGDGRKTTNFGAHEEAYGIAIQSNGKIVVIGRSTPGSDFALARYNTNGALDTTFSSDGRLLTDFGGDDFAYDVAVQADGKIIAVGSTCDPVTDLCNVALARYTASGKLDATFSGDGKVRTDINGQDNGARAVAIQPDGKLVVVGYLWNENDGEFNFVFYRYKTNGGLDTTFSGDGTAIGNIGSGQWDFGLDVAIQSDGKIVGVGSTVDSTGDNFAMARLNANGTLDPTFGKGGLRVTDFGGSDTAHAVAIQPDGKIVVAGQKLKADLLISLFAVARYNTNGSLDTTFNGTGKKTFSMGTGTSSVAHDVIVEPNGKIVVVGDGGDADISQFALARLNANGTFDSTFSGDGKKAIGFCGGSLDDGNALARQPSDGKYVLAGTTRCFASQGDFALVRVLP